MVIIMTISIAWDPTGFYARYPIEPGNWNTVFNPDTREVIATVLAYLVMIFIVALIGVSVILLIKRIRYEYTESGDIQKSIRKLIMAQVILGSLIAACAFLVSVWGFPTSYTFDIADNQSLLMNSNPGPKIIKAMVLSAITALLGVIVLFCGIIQITSSRYRKIYQKPLEG